MAMKTNERPGTRAVLRHCPISSYKAREVLDLIRGLDYTSASEVLEYCERSAAPVIAKLLKSAGSNAEHNDALLVEELYVATAYADEGATQKRWRPRARGRATRIRKRSCHITVVLARMDDERIARQRARVAAVAAERRARRVRGARRRGATEAEAAAPAIEEIEEAAVEEALVETEPAEAVALETIDEAAYAEDTDDADDSGDVPVAASEAEASDVAADEPADASEGDGAEVEATAEEEED